MSRNAATEPKLQPEKQSVPGTSADLARTISYWFLAIVGLIYASGFLVVMIHLGTYGVTDVGGELWKARDIHIGVLALVFPITIMGTVLYVLVSPVKCLFTSRGRGGPDRWWLPHVRRLITGVITLLLELAFYCFAMLHRPGKEPYNILFWMLFVGSLAPLICLLYLDPPEKEQQKTRNGLILCTDPPKGEQQKTLNWKQRLAYIIRLAAAVCVVGLFCLVVATYWPLFTKIAKDGYRVSLYLLLLFVIVVFLYLAYERYALAHERRVLFVTSALVGLMYYLALVGFAHSFFYYIPASRGGGDYTVAPSVCIDLKKEGNLTTAAFTVMVDVFPELLKKEGNPTTAALDAFMKDTSPKVLIDENSTTLFVAADHHENEDEGGPCEWRESYLHKRPKVWAIGRESIAAVRYARPKWDPNAPDPCRPPKRDPNAPDPCAPKPSKARTQ